jgi:hypothetical protein
VLDKGSREVEGQDLFKLTALKPWEVGGRGCRAMFRALVRAWVDGAEQLANSGTGHHCSNSTSHGTRTCPLSLLKKLLQDASWCCCIHFLVPASCVKTPPTQ